MSFHLLDRRQFGLRAAACLSLPALGALQRSALAAGLRRYVKLPAGATVPAVGQAAWHLGQDKRPEAVEQDALLAGIWLGMKLIDTSGNYGNGSSEELIGRVISERQQCLASRVRECIWLPGRDDVYLVSKVESDEVDGDGIRRACDASLRRLQTDHLDLYLLHSPVPTEKFAHVVASFEQLRAAGKIRDWGVSNFSRQQMEDIWRVPDGKRCVTNQVAYSLRYRRAEREVLPWCMEHDIPMMAYSPLGGDNNLVVKDQKLKEIGAAHGVSASAVALAWVIRSGKVIAIPESSTPADARENEAALYLTLTDKELQALEAAYPA